MYCCFMCFFFSSRRRHTRWPRDWSSDVCSSDLLRAGVERVDRHLLVRRSGDLDATVFEPRRRGRDLPAGIVADLSGLRKEVEVLGVGDLGLTDRACFETVEAVAVELAVQFDDELERLRGEDLLCAIRQFAGDLHPGRDVQVLDLSGHRWFSLVSTRRAASLSAPSGASSFAGNGVWPAKHSHRENFCSHTERI